MGAFVLEVIFVAAGGERRARMTRPASYIS